MRVSGPGRAAALLGTCLALVAPVSASASSAPALAHTTTVTAGRSASMLVRLPRAVDVDVYADFTLAPSRGRLTAVVLKKDGPWNAPYAEVTHHGFCATAGCVSPLPKAGGAFIWAPGSTNGLTGRLPAGTYRLYVVTDGGPVTATLRLRGLSGSARLIPRGSVRAGVVTPKATVADPAASPALFAGGGTHTAAKRGGINATHIWKELPSISPSAVGSCVYDDGTPPAGAVPAFQMPCADGAGGFPPFVTSSPTPVDATPTPVGPGRFVSGMSTGYLLPPGAVSIGGYHDTAGPVTAAYVHQLWLDF